MPNHLVAPDPSLIRPFILVDLSTDSPPPLSKKEVTTAVKKLKNGCGSGFDGITAEWIRWDLLVVINNKEAVLKDWTRGILVKLFLKGYVLVNDNWRKSTFALIGLALTLFSFLD